MTKLEIAELMTILQANYPDSFKGQSDAVVGAKVALWHDFFKDIPKEVVSAAVKAFIANDTRGFMPNIGQINEQIHKLTNNETLTEGEAWGLVSSALRNSAYNSREEFEKLPERIRRLVGSSNQLREWALMDAETVNSVVSSNFQRAFRARQKNDIEYQRLPADVKQFAKRLSADVFKELPNVSKGASGVLGQAELDAIKRTMQEVDL